MEGAPSCADLGDAPAELDARPIPAGAAVPLPVVAGEHGSVVPPALGAAAGATVAALLSIHLFDETEEDPRA